MAQQAFRSKSRALASVGLPFPFPSPSLFHRHRRLVFRTDSLQTLFFLRMLLLLLLLIHVPTLRGQNSGSSKRDSIVFIYVDVAPLSFFSTVCSSFLSLSRFVFTPFPFFLSLFLRRSARDCETSFSDTISYRQRLPLLTKLLLSVALLSFFFSVAYSDCAQLLFFLFFFVYLLRRNELRRSAKLVCKNIHHPSDTKTPLNISS